MKPQNALIIADLHLHQLPTWRLAWCEDFITQVNKDYGTTGCCDLYLLGDVFEIRDKLDARVLNLFLRLLKNWHTGDVVWLSGQHDSYIPGKATLYELLDFNLRSGKIFVVDHDVFEHKGYWFVPFHRRFADYRNCLAQVPDDAFVLTHMPTIEILQLHGAVNVEGISIKEFYRFRQVISGDIHKHHDFSKFFYVGAPSQRDWRDKGLDGQIAMLTDGQFKRIPTTHPKHIEIRDSKEIPATGDYIVKTERGTIVKSESANVISCVETTRMSLDSIKVSSSRTIRSQLKEYVRQKPPPCNLNTAMSYALDKLI